MPFEYAKEQIFPVRERHREAVQRNLWWRHARPSPRYRTALVELSRVLVTTSVAKHRIFLWLYPPKLADHALIVFTRSDDYLFGIVHSRPHEIWARATGTQVRERESGFRYTPKSCFETFPFPRLDATHFEAISSAARQLDRMRAGWLTPPAWVSQEFLEFPGSVDGPWARFVTDPNARGIGTVRYPRLVAKDAHVFDLAKRTLTNLYNESPTWLDLAPPRPRRSRLRRLRLVADDDRRRTPRGTTRIEPRAQRRPAHSIPRRQGASMTRKRRNDPTRSVGPSPLSVSLGEQSSTKCTGR